MTTLAEVTAMLPIVTPYTMPTDTATAQILYDIAAAQVLADAPNLTGLVQTRAYCYYIAHLLSSKDGSAAIASESLGEWSHTYKSSSGTDSYLDAYNALINNGKRAALIGTVCAVCINDGDALNYPLDTSRAGGGRRCRP